jgi:putative acetyltransferase
MDGRIDIVIRPERTEDIPDIGRINDEAFGRQVEGQLVARLRDLGALTVSLVAVDRGTIVGHIGFSPMAARPPVAGVNVMALAPVAVLPEFQKRGIGGSLVQAGLDACRELDAGAVFLVGHADYYPRFGFKKASGYGIACEFEAPDEAWMVIEIVPGTLEKLRGVTAVFHPVFREFV